MLEGMKIERSPDLRVCTNTHSFVDAHGSGEGPPVSNAKIQHIAPPRQLDEMWGFIHTREPNLNEGDPEEWGSMMIWLA